MEKIIAYQKQNEKRYLDELVELLKIKSVSADPAFKEEVFKAADFVKDRMTDAGLENIEICPTPGYPVVYGDKIIDPSKPTVLIYGHYDVQPPDPLDLWTSPPFEPVVKDGKLYARGASDDKGQFYLHVKAVESMIKNDALPCNVKFMIEGEEEVGSEHLEGFIETNKDKLAADVVLVSDTSIFANDVPTITTGPVSYTHLRAHET